MRAHHFLLVSAIISTVLALFLGISCSDGGDDDDDASDDDADECYTCETTAECTAAFGQGWGCDDGCCEQIPIDDDDLDDDTSPNDDDDTDEDDDTSDDDTSPNSDDDDETPGTPEWVLETVAPSAPGNRQTSILATPDGRVHLAYTGCTSAQCTESELHYAFKNMAKGEWQDTAVDTTGTATGWYPDLTIDTASTLHISYAYNPEDQEHQQKLMHAFKPAGGAWQTEDSGAGRGGWWTSCGAVGEVFIASHTKLPFSGLDETKMQVVYKNGTEWTYQDVDTSYDSGWFTDLTITPDGKPAVIYGVGYFGGYLQLATFDGADWTIMQIDDGYYGGSIEADADGFFHIAYSREDPTNSEFWELWYATNAPDGQWTKSAVDPGADSEDDTGGFPSLVIDQGGGKHVFYRHFTGNALKYARNLGDDWEITVADPLGGGLYTSSAVDAAGGLHVAYENGTAILYAYCSNCTLK